MVECAVSVQRAFRKRTCLFIFCLKCSAALFFSLGYLPDGTPMNRAGNAINHPETIGPDPHTPGSPLPRALFCNSVGYLPDGTPMSAAGNALNHPETMQPDMHTPGSPLPPSTTMPTWATWWMERTWPLLVICLCRVRPQLHRCRLHQHRSRHPTCCGTNPCFGTTTSGSTIISVRGCDAWHQVPLLDSEGCMCGFGVPQRCGFLGLMCKPKQKVMHNNHKHPHLSLGDGW